MWKKLFSEKSLLPNCDYLAIARVTIVENPPIQMRRGKKHAKFCNKSGKVVEKGIKYHASYNPT